MIQADETPLLVNKDGRPAGSKSYMWVYRTGKYQTDRQVILYDYQKTRKADHPREFLKNFRGVCVTDGYQVYHTLEGELEDFEISGCWAHSRRRYDEAVKALPKSEQKMSLAYLALSQIQQIYHEEAELQDMTPAKSSAIIYSLVETAKANKLRLYEYFNYLLTEIPEHMDDKNNDFCEKLLPWSDELPAECRK